MGIDRSGRVPGKRIARWGDGYMAMSRFGTQSEPSLGRGVYRLAEVARYTGLHPQRVRSWFRDRSDHAGLGPLLYPDYVEVDDVQAASFLDLIDVLVAGQFRLLGVTMGVVRRAYAVLQERLDTRHPFCHKGLFTDRKQIFVSTADELGDEVLSEAVSRQQFFKQVKGKLIHVDFSPETLLAVRWRIARGVMIDPAVHLGKPVIENTGVSTFVVDRAYHANGEDAELVADLFNVSAAGVLDAVAFERDYGVRSAA